MIEHSASAAPHAPPADTRTRLLRAAVTLFQQRGYHAVGLAQILAEAKAPKGSLYHHFPGGKKDLGRAAIDWLTESILRPFKRAKEKDLAARVFIARLFHGTGSWLAAEDFSQGAMLAMLAQGAMTEEPELADVLDRAYTRITMAMADLLRDEGMAALRANEMASLILAALEGSVTLARAHRSTMPLQRASAAIDRVLAGEGLKKER
ncbi:helix-turn-helix domain-containing protein [Litorivita sp. NS0012-18]|uniref:TetR/AcrR family transcriptional regulator n=1 Tax=Litorivita sp. NS0012-18 TaxID=3127655 RepID=UPI0031087289